MIKFLVLEKVFSFLSPDEVERMKQDEEKKIASLTQSELTNWNLDDNQSDEDSETEVLNNKFVSKTDIYSF